LSGKNPPFALAQLWIDVPDVLVDNTVTYLHDITRHNRQEPSNVVTGFQAQRLYDANEDPDYKIDQPIR
jgi:hypothetical protein